MARPREFDEGAVLDAVRDCFWARGYEATSMRDLADATGLTCASLYNAFGDKQALYRRALDHYLAATLDERIPRLERTLPPRQALRAYFDEVIARSLGDKGHRGCMLVNSALDATAFEPKLQREIGDKISRIEAFFLGRIEAGQKDGTITTAQPAADLARQFLGLLMGLRVLVRVRPEPELLEGLIRPAFAALDPAPKPRRRAS